MIDPYSLEEGIEFLIFSSPVTLNGDYFPVKFPFNKVLEIMKNLEDIRLFLD
jgi:hypothetical protein